MQHARDRAVRAGPHIGRGARDRAGDADAAEQRRADIGEALRHQLAVGAVAAAGHAVGDDRREQRFDRAEQREGDRVGQHRLHAVSRSNGGSAGTGSDARYAAEARADRLDRQGKQRPRRPRPAPTRDQHARP